MGTVAPTNAFLTWFAEWGQIVYVGVQILFWAAIATAAVMVALQYKRLVTFKVGGAQPKTADDGSDKPEAETDAFVE
ncbi:MAG: hypothetical protein EG823_06775 [Actinobacteria bacterium]|nr:hypothetical protein [Actinomycetota bacterium]